MEKPTVPVDLAGFALCSWIPGTVMLLVRLFGRQGTQRRLIEYTSALATVFTVAQALLLYFAILKGCGLDVNNSHSAEISKGQTLATINVAFLVVAQGCFKATDVLVVYHLGPNDGTTFRHYVWPLGVLDLLWTFGSTVALNAITSLAGVSLLTSYIITISCLVWRRLYGSELPSRPWSLGRYGLPINIAALALLLPVWFFVL
ncbi:hypothetical protein B0A54_18086 [Friedmanniomyces endolithicus]|uniref:Uncharacterized protein n=1 Tax=Friedmanniomyces endolithicus TaxID=329885 RepID=A0A4U0TKU5_9PEZI|nr:hypothetical protein B0A54_18086 [Friedmanniomyces endolithicus]